MLILQTDMCVLPFPLIPVVSSVVLGVPLSVVAIILLAVAGV